MEKSNLRECASPSLYLHKQYEPILADTKFNRSCLNSSLFFNFKNSTPLLSFLQLTMPNTIANLVPYMKHTEEK